MKFSRVAAVAALTFSASAFAVTQTYTIDPAQSGLTITGSLTGNPASPQTSGSTSTTYSGTIKMDQTGNTIQFNAGSALVAATLATKQEPLSDGTPGSAPANYGRTADGPFFTTTLEAIRGLTLDIQTDPFTINNDNTFNSNNLVLVITAGESDYSYGNSFGTVNLFNKGTANGSSTPSTLETSGGVEKLTLHFATGSIGYGVSSPGDSTISFFGDIVATRVVPEPATMALLAPLGLTLIRRRRS